MGIMMEFERRDRSGNETNIWCPVIYCDQCGQRIEKASEGVFLYPGVDAKPNQLTFLHARAPYHCHIAYEETHTNPDSFLGPKRWPWHHLDVFIVQLVNNLRLDQKHIDLISADTEES